MSAERGLGGRAFARGFVSGATVPRSADEAERETSSSLAWRAWRIRYGPVLDAVADGRHTAGPARAR
jgi:hypothetical protein